MDILISITNFIVLIILCASNFKNCLELIYSHLLKHCYQGCYLFCENKHGLIDMHLIVRLIRMKSFDFVKTL